MQNIDYFAHFEQPVQFSSVHSLDRLVRRGGNEGRISRDPLPVFSAGGPCEQFWHGHGCPLFNVPRPAFPLTTTASPTLQGATKDGFGEAVVACDMPEPGKFPSLRYQLQSKEANHIHLDAGVRLKSPCVLNSTQCQIQSW